MTEDNPTTDGYLRFPAIGGSTLLFVSEDDLWSAPVSGGTARRLTADLARIGRPAISRDGTLAAFTSDVEGTPEVYAMPAAGGPAQRLTWLGDPRTEVCGLTDDGEVLFASSAGRPFGKDTRVFAVPAAGGAVRRLPYGAATTVVPGPAGAVLVGRHTLDPATWKRYRGGRVGRLWIDPAGTGDFHRLLAELDTNVGSPLWIGDRIYFVSDHEGVGNLYSCTPAGAELRRHTDHDTYYVRHASTDGHRIVYQHAAQLWLLDPATDAADRIPLRLAGPHTQRTRRFVDAAEHLGGVALHPQGHSLVADVRGKLVTMPAWEEAATQHGVAQGVRYRLAAHLDADRLCAVSDADGEDGLDVLSLAPGQEGQARRLAGGETGRARELAAAPDGGRVAVANHRRELLVVAVADGTVRVLDTSPAGPISGLAWSPDSAWLAYSFPVDLHHSGIRVVELSTGAVHEVTRPRFADTAPHFDPRGRYLYFLSRRTYLPVSDQLQFDYGFPKASRPYLVTLRAELPSPFVPTRRPLDPPEAKDESKDDAKDDAKNDRGEDGSTTAPVRIDFDGIDDRTLSFPVPEENYTQVLGIGEKVLTLTEPTRSHRGDDIFDDEHGGGTLGCWDLTNHEHKVLTEDVDRVTVSADHSTMLYRGEGRLRVLRAGTEPPKEPAGDPDQPGRETGWIDLDRIRLAVDPTAEWPQMLAEAWRLQRDKFWVADMSGVDWPAILERYRPLAERVATRSEFSDLLCELQGELGTSHAYEIGGDYRPTQRWNLGLLGADLQPDPDTGRWRISHLPVGDSWDDEAGSPLAAPGLGVAVGDTVLAVGGQPVDPQHGPGPALVHRAGQAVELTVAGPDGAQPRRITVTTLRSERALRYREWVEHNRRRVHEATDGRIGYLHIPDMSLDGFAEFHRGFLTEIERDGLVVDVRFNSGGNVSGLLLAKLARRRIGGEIGRWMPSETYPSDAPAGPMVCVADECAGSDGDMFTHAFARMELGPVVGQRTWGGVIGIDGEYRLADGTLTTQPEYAVWFDDVGWGLENHGAEPDIEVVITPQDYAAGRDPQLDRAIEVVQAAVAEHRPSGPDLDRRTPTAAAALPPRA